MPKTVLVSVVDTNPQGSKITLHWVLAITPLFNLVAELLEATKNSKIVVGNIFLVFLAD